MNQVLSFFKQANKEQSFEAKLAPYIDLLFKVAYQYTGTKSDAEDLTQDLLIYLYENQQKLQKVEKLKPWLMRCLYHKFIDNCRRNKNHNQVTELDDTCLENLAAHKNDYAQTIMNQQIVVGLQTLSPNQRAVVSLHDIQGHSLTELAEILDKPLGTLKSDLHRARAKLKNFLKLQPSDLDLRQYL
ncbi:RNA polymerase sigma factor [Catenovulum maritimum]|uniref:RNA polymerase subunit sigma-24 n=1 Tax=Catenovulum maritimum TaxID=1513271 RepID=A0A0J8GXK1_9ALTE|nr:RNA polymerase sigma factor [Catenovulum maritimum]KMT65979.1 hypothetical protein XM47_05860 [Catenovulum maritimum]